MKFEELNRYQLRKVADYLYDGVPEVAHLMAQVRQFKDGDRVLLWLVKNKIRGQRMVDFFKEESGKDSSKGVMRGVQRALSFINGHKRYLEPLKTRDLK